MKQLRPETRAAKQKFVRKFMKAMENVPIDEVARRLGVSKQTVRKMYTGVHLPIRARLVSAMERVMAEQRAVGTLHHSDLVQVIVAALVAAVGTNAVLEALVATERRSN